MRRRATVSLPLAIDLGERLPLGVADDEAGVGLLDGLGRRLALKLHSNNTKTPDASISPPAIRSPIMSSVVVQWPVRMIAAPVAMLAAMRRDLSRVRLIARQAVRCSDMSGIGRERKCATALETTFMTPEQTLKGAPITVGSNQALVSGSLQSFVDTSDKVVLIKWLV